MALDLTGATPRDGVAKHCLGLLLQRLEPLRKRGALDGSAVRISMKRAAFGASFGTLKRWGVSRNARVARSGDSCAWLHRRSVQSNEPPIGADSRRLAKTEGEFRSAFRAEFLSRAWTPRPKRPNLLSEGNAGKAAFAELQRCKCPIRRPSPLQVPRRIPRTRPRPLRPASRVSTRLPSAPPQLRFRLEYSPWSVPEARQRLTALPRSHSRNKATFRPAAAILRRGPFSAPHPSPMTMLC